MNGTIRRKLEMAARVRDFSKANPGADPSYGIILARLEDRLGRVEALAAQQRGGLIAVRATTAYRLALRRALHHHLLRHLVRVGEVAAREVPEIAQRFRLPPTNASTQVFLTAARAMVEEAQGQRALLVRHGMAETLVADLVLTLRQYDAAWAEAHAGRREHVGASADLKAVTDEITALVALLDGLNRYRFRDDAERSAAWDSAKNVVRAVGAVRSVGSVGSVGTDHARAAPAEAAA